MLAYIRNEATRQARDEERANRSEKSEKEDTKSTKIQEKSSLIPPLVVKIRFEGTSFVKGRLPSHLARDTRNR